MKLIPRNVNEIPQSDRSNFKPTRNYEILTAFVESGEECVELVDYHHTSAYCAQNCFNVSARRFNINSVKCIVRGERVFLVKVL